MPASPPLSSARPAAKPPRDARGTGKHHPRRRRSGAGPRPRRRRRGIEFDQSGDRAGAARRSGRRRCRAFGGAYYNKPIQAGIQAHFRAIAISTALPIILHDVPSRTMRELSDDTLLRLAIPAIHRAEGGGGDITRLLRLRPRLPAGFRLLSGDDTTALPFITNGGDGCISIVQRRSGIVPGGVFECRLGRPQSAKYLQARLAP